MAIPPARAMIVDAQTLFLLQMTVNIVVLFLILLVVAGMWAVCRKAEQPGWSAMVPGYNLYVLTVGVARIDMIWFILALIPGIGFFSWGVICNEVARRFNRGIGFALGLSVMPMLFWPILGYNDDRYIKKLKPLKPIKRLDHVEDEFDDEDEESPVIRKAARTVQRASRSKPSQ